MLQLFSSRQTRRRHWSALEARRVAATRCSASPPGGATRESLPRALAHIQQQRSRQKSMLHRLTFVFGRSFIKKPRAARAPAIAGGTTSCPLFTEILHFCESASPATPTRSYRNWPRRPPRSVSLASHERTTKISIPATATYVALRLAECARSIRVFHETVRNNGGGVRGHGNCERRLSPEKHIRERNLFPVQ